LYEVQRGHCLYVHQGVPHPGQCAWSRVLLERCTRTRQGDRSTADIPAALPADLRFDVRRHLLPESHQRCHHHCICCITEAV